MDLRRIARALAERDEERKGLSGLLGDLPPPRPGLLAGLMANDPRMMGYSVRQDLYPSEDQFFRANPSTAGMASESGHVVLNPYSGPEVNRDAVARNEAMRLYMRQRGIVPDFPVTEQQRSYFAGTAYGQDEGAMKSTVAARIYSGDPSANATPEQQEWVRGLLGRYAIGR